MKNAVGREIPAAINGYGQVKPFSGAFAAPRQIQKSGSRVISRQAQAKGKPSGTKVLPSVDAALDAVGIKDGMTVSFHHHMRNGDYVMNMVMEAIAARGIKDIHVAASGIFACHEPLVEYIEKGVITRISVNYISPGPVAKAITQGKLKYPAVFRSHGGRPRAIESGELHIDVAFIASPTADEYGNINGTHGKSPCGVLSYAYSDAQYADVVVAVTDNLVPYPACPIEISQDLVDYVVTVASIGDPAGIVSGTMKVTTDPINLMIANRAAILLDEIGCIKNGMSLQTGAGGTSLAVAAEVHKIMKQKGVVGSFGAGGITGYFVNMLREGLFKALFDVQCFDALAIQSAGTDPRHMAMSASQYGNPHNRGAVVNKLDIMILGATEIDLDFNVNVVTGTEGTIIGASGGNNDTAAGARVSVVVTNLVKGRLCVLREKVTTVTTPGETVDVLVTDRGIAVNPIRQDIIAALRGTKLPVMDIRELLEVGYALTGVPDPVEFTDEVVGVVEYRDGTVIDVVRKPK